MPGPGSVGGAKYVRAPTIGERFRPKTGPAADPDVAALVRRHRVKFRSGGDDAIYDPLNDQVTVPPIDRFQSPTFYRATAVHEIAHWTGHARRLDRGMRHWYGPRRPPTLPERALEEVVAELTAAVVCELIWPDTFDRDHHLAYIRWVSTCAPPHWRPTATFLATQAATYLLEPPRS